jgi:hypothetical protein
MKTDPGSIFSWEWESAPSVRAPELRATWARLEMSVGSDHVTLVEDRESGSARRSIHVPLYPVAEWVAYNWWLLKADSRPTQGHRRHSLRSAGDGFSWPDLLIVPEGRSTRLTWRRDSDVQPGRTVRFIGEGQAWLDSAVVEHALALLVESVLTRLAEQGVTDTALSREWSVVRQADVEEVEFCMAAARLGLDPYSEALDIQDQILRVADELSGSVYDDFLDAVSPRLIAEGLEWISRGVAAVRQSTTALNESIERLKGEARRQLVTNGHRPWELGYEQASQVRQLLGIDVTADFDPSTLLTARMESTDDGGLQALGGAMPEAGSLVVLGRQQPDETRRFTLARALWHVVYQDESLFLVTGARTDRQKMERAFAAELLAPAEGVAARLQGDVDVVLQEDVEQVAQHFRVSPMVVQHQLENRLSSTVAD